MVIHVLRKIALTLAVLLTLTPVVSSIAYAQDVDALIDFANESIEDANDICDMDIPDFTFDTDICCTLKLVANDKVVIESSEFTLGIASSVSDLYDEALTDSEYQDSADFDITNAMIRVNGEEIVIDPDCYILDDGDSVEMTISDEDTCDVDEEVIPEVILEDIPELVMASQEDIESALDSASATITSIGEKSKWESGNEFGLLSLARDGKIKESYVNEYYSSISKKLSANKSPVIKENISTENSKAVIALTAMGVDPTSVNGYNLLEPLSDMTYIIKQGINGTVWALLAFDSHSYEIPACQNTANQATRENIIKVISDAQHADGGWAYGGLSSDVDMTAMALQALAPYYGRDGFEDATAAVDKAINWLSFAQDENGAFSTGGLVTSESISQVIIALTTLGIDVDSDARFVKNGKSAMDALMTFKVKGGFKHISSETGKNNLGTTQGYTALVAYQRAKNGESGIYDMNDVTELKKLDNGSQENAGKPEDSNSGNGEGDKNKDEKEDSDGDKASGKTKSLGALTLGDDSKNLNKKITSQMRKNNIYSGEDNIAGSDEDEKSLAGQIPDITMWIVIGLAALAALIAMVAARLRHKE
ncbi:MAG: terpene cyclase/mutase family protein [Firmicutes bacterium]|nr:terpene cyclase/mutase family protein [Bacillota bacterium]